MEHRTQHVVAALAALVLLGSAAGRSLEAADEEGSSPAIEEARRIAEDVGDALPGLSVAVGSGGKVVWAEGFGWADLEAGAEATPGTRFHVYSAAKAWTAAAGLRLTAEGRLGLEEPIGSHLPELSGPLAGATPYQLATHTAGVRHYRDGEAEPDGRHCDSVGEAVAIFRDDPLLFSPGTDRAYSSWSYVLLSAVIEAAAGEPFVEVLDGRVLTLAGMEHTRIADPAVEIPGKAVPYRRAQDGDWERVVGLDVTCKWGAGGFLSTAPDLVRFYLALLQGDLLEQRSAGMLIRPEEDGSFRFGGFSHGGRSVIVGNVRTGVVVALATNAQAAGVDLGGAAERILERFEAGRPDAALEVLTGQTLPEVPDRVWEAYAATLARAGKETGGADTAWRRCRWWPRTGTWRARPSSAGSGGPGVSSGRSAPTCWRSRHSPTGGDTPGGRGARRFEVGTGSRQGLRSAANCGAPARLLLSWIRSSSRGGLRLVHELADDLDRLEGRADMSKSVVCSRGMGTVGGFVLATVVVLLAAGAAGAARPSTGCAG